MNKQLAILVTLFLCQAPNNAKVFQFAAGGTHKAAQMTFQSRKLFQPENAEEFGQLTTQFFAISEGVDKTILTNSSLATILVDIAALSILQSKGTDGNSSKTVFNQIFAQNALAHLLDYKTIMRKAYDKFVDEAGPIGDKAFDKNEIIKELSKQTGGSSYIASRAAMRERVRRLNAEKESAYYKLLPGSATLVGAYLANPSTNNPRLRIFHIGNSHFIKFKETRTEDDNYLILMPEFITEDSSMDYNSPSCLSDRGSVPTPHNLSLIDDNELRSGIINKSFEVLYSTQIKEYEVGVSVSDVLLASSKGLLQNIPGPLLVVLVNYTLAILEVAEDDDKLMQMYTKKPEMILEKIIVEYLKATKAQNEDILQEVVMQQNANSEFQKFVKLKYDPPLSASEIVEQATNYYVSMNMPPPSQSVKKKQPQVNGSLPQVNNVLQIDDEILDKSTRYCQKEGKSDFSKIFKYSMCNGRIVTSVNAWEHIEMRQQYLKKNFVGQLQVKNEANNFRENHQSFEVSTQKTYSTADPWKRSGFSSNNSRVSDFSYTNDENDYRTSFSSDKKRSDDSHIKNYKDTQQVEQQPGGFNEDDDEEDSQRQQPIDLNEATSSYMAKLTTDRLKFLQDFKLSGCPMKEYHDIGNSTQVPTLNKIKLSDCIYKKLSELKVRSNLLPKYGFSFLSNALAKAAIQVMLTQDHVLTPKGAKSTLKGEDPVKQTDEDIIVITTGLEVADYNQHKVSDLKGKADTSLKNTKNKMGQALTSFLIELVRHEDEFDDVLQRIAPSSLNYII